MEKYEYFNPNICHVCKLPDNGNLMPCYNCGLVFYCCNKHKIFDEKSHIVFCTAIIRATELINSELYTSCNLEDWLKSREKLISFIEQYLQRSLKAYEAEVIMCAKSCFSCHKQTDLGTCTLCYSINYCTDHKADFIIQHTTCKKDFLVLRHINYLSIYKSPYFPYPEHMKFMEFPEKKPYFDMTTFVYQYIVLHDKEVDDYPWLLKDYIYSDYMSNPLTLYNAYKELDILNTLQNTETFIIHILAACAVDIIGLKAWELFKHLCQNIKVIRVVMIQSEVNFASNEYKDTCGRCRKNNTCKFYFERVTVSYHEYVNTASYKQPNVIIGSLARFHSVGIWPEFPEIMSNQKCPILLTAKSLKQIKRIITTLRSVLTTETLFYGENKYRGLKPYRDYETGGIFYHNQYVLIFSRYECLTE